MKYYRDLLERVEQEGSEILQEPQTLLWKQAQRTARANGTVSETRLNLVAVSLLPKGIKSNRIEPCEHRSWMT